MFPLSEMSSTGAVLSAYTTFAASAVLVRTLVYELQSVGNQLIPNEIQHKLISKLGSIFRTNLSSTMCVVIKETNGVSNNDLFEAAEVYLSTRIDPTIKKLKVSKTHNERNLSVSADKGEEVLDSFDGIPLKWRLVCVETQKTSTAGRGGISSETVERRSFELSFNSKFQQQVLKYYLPFVMERAKALKEETKVVRLHMHIYNEWNSVNLEHPSTFDTLAMDAKAKQEVIDDLDMFMRRRDFYKRVGKAWKRGYLLYGPPGTGKSSLIAAMANHLKFDIYDVELASLYRNEELRMLLMSTKNRSIMVIEDIDCSIELENREDDGMMNGSNASQQKITLSGLLNFVDRLWSSCGDEKIIVFTTNHKERLDPALLSPGRMDMHIHMSYCSFEGFKTLASNYLGIKSHGRFEEIEGLLAEVEATPAEIAEELMKSEQAEAAVENVVELLQKKREEGSGMKVKVEKKVICRKRKASRSY